MGKYVGKYVGLDCDGDYCSNRERLSLTSKDFKSYYRYGVSTEYLRSSIGANC